MLEPLNIHYRVNTLWCVPPPPPRRRRRARSLPASEPRCCRRRRRRRGRSYNTDADSVGAVLCANAKKLNVRHPRASRAPRAAATPWRRARRRR